MDAYRCPGCHAYAGPAVADGGTAVCPVCRLPLDGPEIAELRSLDAELGAVEARRAVLHQRRAALVGQVRARQYAAADGSWHVPLTDAPPRSAQNVLLSLGGVLIVVAGLVFTLVSWGSLGIGGRGSVLTALTALVLAAPLALRRRGLDATAETASAVGLALVLLDAYAARAAGVAGLAHTDAAAYWAAVTALSAAAAAAYARATRSRLVPYAALLLLQCPALLVAASLRLDATGFAYAMLAAAVADAAVARALRMPAARTAAFAVTAAAVLLAAPAASAATTLPSALRAAAPLALAAALSLTTARSLGAAASPAAAGSPTSAGPLTAARSLAAARLLTATRSPTATPPLTDTRPPTATPPLADTRSGHPRALAAARSLATAGSPAAAGPLAAARPPTAAPSLAAARSGRTRAWAAAVLGGLALVGAVGALPWAVLGDGWRVAGVAGAAAAVGFAALAGMTPVPVVGPVRRAQDPLWGGVFAAGAAVLALCAADVLPDLAHALVRMRSGGHVPVVAAVLAALPAGAAGRFGRQRTPLLCGAALAAVGAVVTAPLAAGWPYAASLAVAGTAALGAGLWLLRRPAADALPQACALLAPAAVALAWSLTHDAAALTVWAAAAALAACLTAAGRHAVPAAAFAVCALGYEAARAGAAAGLAPHLAAFAVLGVGIATVPVAARLRGRVGLAVEHSGYALGAVALAATAAHPDALSAALGIAGAGAAGTAVRADRRTRGAVAAGVLLAASSWVRLGLAGVTAPEPYTVSVSAVLLAVGHLRRRRDPALGSWPAYGSGLAFSLLPSLVAAWAGTHWLRPLLLGVTALAVTLLGARHRLRAPLLTGGAVLLADAARELAPSVAHTVGRLPHWVAVAGAGLLLLYVGATYERRLRTAQRLRTTFHTLT